MIQFNSPITPKIAFIIDEFAGPIAGTEKHLLSLIEGLTENTFEVHLVCLRRSRHLGFNSLPCPVHVLSISKLFSPGAILAGLNLCRLLRVNRISIAHVFFPDASVIVPLFCRLAGTSVILSRRDMGFAYTPQHIFLLKLNRLFVDRVIVNSQAVKHAVCSTERWVSSRRVKVIYNGVDLSQVPNRDESALRSQLNIPPEAPIVGMVSNLNPWKRHSDLIDAFSLVHKQRPDTHLVIVGDGVMKPQLEHQTSALGLTAAIHFTGTLPHVGQIISHLSVAVLCSETEGFSNALLEYMAYSKPVVATRTGGNLDIIDHGRNGFMVPVGKTEALAECILALLHDADLRSKLGSEALKTVASRFTMSRMLTAHMAMYFELVARRHSFKTNRRLSR
ncbi:MAG: glycosyltransferase [Thermodesulfobacteriota bacterium]|nr:glycosyltransferase [Thermodesulfobacteriota bacterium]